MRWSTARLAWRWLVAVFAVLVACALILKAAGTGIRLGPPPEFGWTAYPMLAVMYRVEPSGSVPPAKVPPSRILRKKVGTLVTWADGTRTLHIDR